MSTTLPALRDRVTSVCAAAPFSFDVAMQPFDFVQQPTGLVDQVVRVTSEGGAVIGGLNYTEDRTDLLNIWVARKHAATPEATYRQLLTDATSIRAAVIRDGAGAGDYAVPNDGAGISIDKDPGREYAVLRLTLPLNYEAVV